MATIIRVGGGAGGGLAFTVVGGTTIPSSPSENTVWVKTSTAIKNVYAQVYAPANPVAGDVWINTYVNLDAEGNAIVSDALTMTISESPFIRISAKSGKQWNGSSWKTCPTRVYKNGAWSPDTLIILMDGVWGLLGEPTILYRSTSKQSDTTKMPMTYENGYMYIKSSVTGKFYYRLYIETPIDVAPYNTMTAVGYSPDSVFYGWAFLNATIKGSSSHNDDDYLAGYINNGSATNPVTATADISSANGQMYFGVGLYPSESNRATQCYFREITLSA